MKINQNNDITMYRGETAAIDFKVSQRTDYYVPFLISSGRVDLDPVVCITIGSTRRESKNIVTKQFWLTWADLGDLPLFDQTVVTDLTSDGVGLELGINVGVDDTYENLLAGMIEPGIMYQFLKKTEVAAGNPQRHFTYSVMVNEVEIVHIDDYDFTIVMTLDETDTLDMTNVDYFYQIELMDTIPMIDQLLLIFADEANSALFNKMPTAFNVAYENDPSTAIAEYTSDCIALVTKTWPNYWGYKVNDPLTSPVASVTNIQMLQSPRQFIVQSVLK